MTFMFRSLALAPVLVIQGRWVRSRVPKLPEPPGDREGETGSGRRLRLLIVGDSAAAGVGAPHQDEALLGQTVARLAPRFRVAWNLQAESGATTKDALSRLEALTAESGPTLGYAYGEPERIVFAASGTMSLLEAGLPGLLGLGVARRRA